VTVLGVDVNLLPVTALSKAEDAVCEALARHRNPEQESEEVATGIAQEGASWVEVEK
jgi:hypothetical protein